MFFTDINQFPEVADGKIKTVPFLEASKVIVKFVELLGTVFSPVKNDISGNIEKLYNIYHTDEEVFSNINAIFERELKIEGERVGIDALLWLKRGLEYVKIFLTCLIEDSQNSPSKEDLSPFFHKAYEESLKPYHGWIVQKLFALIVHAAPYRTALLQLMAGQNENASEEEILHVTEGFLRGLGCNIDAINHLYETHNICIEYKV